MHTHINTQPTPDVPHPDNKALAQVEILRFAPAAKHLRIKEATLRHIRFYADDRKSADGHVIPGNGFAPAFLKLGRAVYVDLAVFMEIWREQQLQGASRKAPEAKNVGAIIGVSK